MNEQFIYETERKYRVNTDFTDGELWAITTALNQFMYDNPKLTEEQFALCEQALDKISNAL
jgi:hypothetical protein